MRLWSLIAAFLVPGMLFAGYLDDIGYTELLARGITEDGTGVTVVQVEASSSNSTYAYLPNPADSAFSGVVFTDASSSYNGTISSHATMVGKYFYGSASMASGISSVTTYYVSDWLGSGFLNSSPQTAPKIELNDVVNHSWVGSKGSNSEDLKALNRLDFAIERDDFVCVVGVNNGSASTSPNLLASAYNVISVGLSNGNHATSGSTVNTSVTYPLIVVPASVGYTSYATPVVSSASALLIQAAREREETSTNGDKSEVIKAVLLAGTTKDTLASSWSRTDTSPLDAIYGSGMLNIANSYDILTAGEQAANGVVASTGWDYNTMSLNASVFYSFDLMSVAELSVSLTWNAIYSGNNYNSLSLSLPNFNLYLYRLDEGGLTEELIQQSIDPDGNVEYLYLPNLASGSYAIEVRYAGNTSGSLTSASYAVAWNAVVPEPTSGLLLLLGGLGIFVARKFAARDK